MPRFLRLLLVALCLCGTAVLGMPVGSQAGGRPSRGFDDNGNYIAPIGDSPATANDTPYSSALRCLGRNHGGRELRIAVGQIADETSRPSAVAAGPAVTQGASLMAMAALAKAGVSMVERADISVPLLERKLALRASMRSSRVPRSDLYLTGGISEFNPQIARTADGLEIASIAVDLRLVDSTTLEVVDMTSYQKQILTSRTSQEMAREPVQRAVRSIIERSVLEMLSRLYRASPESCGMMQPDAQREVSPELPRFFPPDSSTGAPLRRQEQ